MRKKTLACWENLNIILKLKIIVNDINNTIKASHISLDTDEGRMNKQKY